MIGVGLVTWPPCGATIITTMCSNLLHTGRWTTYSAINIYKPKNSVFQIVWFILFRNTIDDITSTMNFLRDLTRCVL